MKKIAIALALAAGFTGAASAQAVYGKVGLLGAGIGYAHGISNHFTLRGDFTTIGSHNKTGTSDELDYEGKLKLNQTGLYADWFPFAGTFRVTGGVNFRDANLTAHARANQLGNVTINDTTVQLGSGDSLTAKVKLPSTAPYIGIGWGHNVASQKPGFSFFADIGLSIGKPKVSLNVTDSLLGKLDAATGGRGQAEIDQQIATIKDDANKVKALPQVYVGVAYKF